MHYTTVLCFQSGVILWSRRRGWLGSGIMSDEEPIIDLEPRNPFSWRIVVGFVVGWLVMLGIALALKTAMVRVLLPVIALVFLVYLVICTLYFLKNRN